METCSGPFPQLPVRFHMFHMEFHNILTPRVHKYPQHRTVALEVVGNVCALIFEASLENPLIQDQVREVGDGCILYIAPMAFQSSTRDFKDRRHKENRRQTTELV